MAASHLFIPGTSGSGLHVNRVKKIGIWPLNEEFDALTSIAISLVIFSHFRRR